MNIKKFYNKLDLYTKHLENHLLTIRAEILSEDGHLFVVLRISIIALARQ